MLPGQLEHAAALAAKTAGVLLFTDVEIAEFKTLADECGVKFDPAELKAE